MNNFMRKSLFVFMLTGVLTSMLFLFLYHYDNKYTYPAPAAMQKSRHIAAPPVGQNGVLLLDNALDDLPFFYLIDGWAFYQNRLLSPHDLQDGGPVPDRYIYIGQYGGFELDDPDASPYGCATYRLNVFTGTGEEKRYTLELPEIFSAYTLWINGEPVKSSGTVSHSQVSHQPAIFHSSVTFAASDRIDILLAVSNYDHYYSGLFYPPALGNPDAVNGLLFSQLFYNALAFWVALIVGIFYLCIGQFVHNKKTAFTFGVLCFLYGGSLSHAPLHFTTVTTTGFWYRFEDFCFYGMLLCTSYLYFLLCPRQRKKKTEAFVFISYAILIAGALICFTSLFVPVVLHADAMRMMVYSHVVNFYKICLVTYLLFASILSFRRDRPYAPPLLAAAVCFAVSLAVDAFVPLYEPIRFGWPTEVGGFLMTIILGAGITYDIIQSFRERHVLRIQNRILSFRSRHTEQYLALQTEHYQDLSANIAKTKRTNHDMRHQLAVLKGFAGAGDMASIFKYIENILGHLPSEPFSPVCKNHAASSVVRYYMAMAKQNGVKTDILLNLSEQAGLISDYDLCIVLGNLLENAIEAGARITDGEKYLFLHSSYQERYLILMMDNSFDGTIRKKNDTFYSLKRDLPAEDETAEGIGLASIRAIAEKYGGYAVFESNANTFHSSVALKYK